MPTAWIPASFSASQPIAGSAKKPSLPTEWLDEGAQRQHSRLLKITSARRSSSAMQANGTAASVTFMRLTSPVKISSDIELLLRLQPQLPHDGAPLRLFRVNVGGLLFRGTRERVA